jgi:hypothetical protein
LPNTGFSLQLTTAGEIPFIQQLPASQDILQLISDEEKHLCFPCTTKTQHESPRFSPRVDWHEMF